MNSHKRLNKEMSPALGETTLKAKRSKIFQLGSPDITAVTSNS